MHKIKRERVLEPPLFYDDNESFKRQKFSDEKWQLSEVGAQLQELHLELMQSKIKSQQEELNKLRTAAQISARDNENLKIENMRLKKQLEQKNEVDTKIVSYIA